jgi:hypothetical protein
MPHQRTLRLELPGDGAIRLTVHHAKMLQRVFDGETVRHESKTAMELRSAHLIVPVAFTATQKCKIKPTGILALKLYRLFAA